MKRNTTLNKLERISGLFFWNRSDFVEYCKVLATYNEPCATKEFYNETRNATAQILICGTKESIKTFFEWHIQHDDLYKTKYALLSGCITAFQNHSKAAFKREFLFQDWFLDMFKSLYEGTKDAYLVFMFKRFDTGNYVYMSIEQFYEMMCSLRQRLFEELHKKYMPGGSEYEDIKTHFIKTANEHQ